MEGRPLILSVFPGLDLLGKAFEQEWPEACIVRGPDVLWGGDVHNFHPPSGVFDGVIGGPPCQVFSRLRHINPKAGKHGNLIPEFQRVVWEAQPVWFLMENVPDAPPASVPGYKVFQCYYNNRWAPEAPEQNRVRRFTFGTGSRRILHLEESCFENPDWAPTVTAGSRAQPVALGGSGKPKAVRIGSQQWGSRALPGRGPLREVHEMCRLQGLPEDYLDASPFTTTGKRQAIGNGVPLPMGRAIARAVRRALEQ